MTIPSIPTERLAIEPSRKYEQSIPAQHRLMNGQYYTPAPLCDMMLSLVCSPVDAKAMERLLEPGCGAGNFLLRAYERFQAQCQASGLQRGAILQHLHGIELDAEAAQLAMAQLAQASGESVSNILVRDFISLAVDSWGQFDVIVGNPPYVRQEHVAQSVHMNKQATHAYLLEKYADYLAAYPQQKALFSQTGDLYLWFYLQAATLLKPGGKLAFVTSNSWLNAAYGQAFRVFLSHHFQVLYMVESACERWFKDAAINPLVLVLQKKEQPFKAEEDASSAQLIRLQKPLTEWMPDSQSPDYWQALDAKIQALPQDADVFCNTVPQSVLWAEQDAGLSWSFLLRAPAELMRFVQQPDLWMRLEQWGRVRYPLKTGINRFFYLSRAQAEAWRIEPEYLFPVIRSARKVTTYEVQADACEEFLFSCSDALADLEHKGKNGALAYIRWGETQSAPPRQKRSGPVPWPQVPSVQSNNPWYFVKPLAPAHILCSRFIDQRFFFPLCQGNVMEDQTFYGLTLNETMEPNALSPMLAAALLNSTLSYVLVEYNARTNLGEGVLQYARCDMAALPVLNPDLYTEAEQANIMSAFQRMMSRPILSIADEVHLPDRVALDLLVLVPLLARLNIEEDVAIVRNRLSGYLIDRVLERQTLARSARGKA